MRTLNLLNPKFKLTGLLLSLALTTNLAQAAGPKCENLFSDDVSVATAAQNSTSFYVSKIKGSDIVLTAAAKQKLKSIFDDHGIVLETSNLREAIEGAVEVIQDGNTNPSVAKSDKLARIAKDALKALDSHLNKNQKMVVQYLFAESVLRLEAIKMSEYKSESKAPDVFASGSRLKSNEFNKNVESYIDGTALYDNLGGDVGIIEWHEIRSLYANNSWVIGLKDHDMYHLHYSYGHPFYLAVNFHASRSMNDRRYHMISSLWESVDTFRTGFESAIADYMKDKGLSPQEGMLLLATATEADLNKIEAEVGQIDITGSYSTFYQASYKNGWRPVAMKTERGGSIKPDTYVKELEKYINDSLARIEKPENKRYKNYHRKGAGKTSAVDEDRVAEY